MRGSISSPRTARPHRRGRPGRPVCGDRPDHGGTTGKLDIGNTAIDVRTPSDDYRHFFLADGIHIGTAAQALLANLFIQTVDTSFNAGITPLSPAEILRVARRPGLM